MPFPLAHPAAVLPLKRYCPRLLDLPALLVGSITPDLAYPLGLGDFSHTFVGSFGFCLPVGLALIAAYYGLGPWLEHRFSANWRQAPWMLLRPSRGHWLGVVVSLLLGAWSHLLIDGFTHKDGWFVEHLPFLRLEIVAFSGRALRVFHVVWYALSFAGVLCVCWAYQNARPVSPSHERPPTAARWAAPLFFAGITVVLGALHHLTRGHKSAVVVELLTLALLGAMLFVMGPGQRGVREKRQGLE